jgi:hypothetical protein
VRDGLGTIGLNVNRGEHYVCIAQEDKSWRPVNTRCRNDRGNHPVGPDDSDRRGFGAGVDPSPRVSPIEQLFIIYFSLRYIILPQAVRIVLPPLLNTLIILLKDTSVCSLISTEELMLRVKDLAMMSFLPMHLFLLAGFIYFFLAWPLSLVTRRIEKWMQRGRRQTFGV